MAYTESELEKILRGESGDEIFDQATEEMGPPLHTNIPPEKEDDFDYEGMLNPQLPEKEETQVPELNPEEMEMSAQLVEDEPSTPGSEFDAIPPPTPDAPMDEMSDRSPDGAEAPPMDVSEAPSKLDQLRADAEKKKNMLRLLKSFSELGQASLIKYNPNIKPENKTLDTLIGESDSKVKEYLGDRKRASTEAKEDRAAKLDKIKIGKQTLEFTNLQKTSDPGSAESKFAQDEFIRHRKNVGKPVDEEAVRRISAKDLHANSKHLQAELTRIMQDANNKANRASREGIAADKLKASKEDKKLTREQRAKTEDRLTEALGTRKEELKLKKTGEERRREKLDFTKDETDKSRKEKIITAFNKDKTSEGAKQGIVASMKADAIIKKGGKMAPSVMGRLLARMAGEVGVMTDKDVEAFRGSAAWDDSIERFFQRGIKGTLTETDKAEMANMVKIMKEINEDALAGTADTMAKQNAAASGLDENEIYNMLMPKEAKHMMRKMDSTADKTVVKKGYNAKTNQTQLVYSDGTKEVVEGRQ